MRNEEYRNDVLRFFTVPASLASVGLTIAAAELVSSTIMFVAAGVGAAGAVSLIFTGMKGRPITGTSSNSSSIAPVTPVKQTSERPMAARY